MPDNRSPGRPSEMEVTQLYETLKRIQKRIDSVSLSGISWAKAIEMLTEIREEAKVAIRRGNAG
jgi:hypothetical protein